MQNRLKFLRESRQWSQPKMSLKSGVPQTTIIVVFRGQELEAWEQKEDEP